VCDAVISFVVVVVASEMGMRRKEGRKSRNRNVILDAGIAKKKKKNVSGLLESTTLAASMQQLWYHRPVSIAVV
jgi:hypothetical protein